MPDESGVQLKGADEAARDMRRWATEVAPAVAKRSRDFADHVRGQVDAKVPVLTGTLAASIDVVDEEAGAGVSIGDGVPYAAWIEFGGSRGRPLIPEGRYLFPTAIESESEFAAMAAGAAADTVGRFSWSTPPV